MHTSCTKKTKYKKVQLLLYNYLPLKFVSFALMQKKSNKSVAILYMVIYNILTNYSKMKI